MWLSRLMNVTEPFCAISLLFFNFFSLCLFLLFMAAQVWSEREAEEPHGGLCWDSTMPSHIFSVSCCVVSCQSRSPAISVFLGIWWNTAAGFWRLESPFGLLSQAVTLVKKSTIGEISCRATGSWRKLMQSYRFMKSCITAHCFYDKPFYRPPCGNRGTSVHTGLSAPSPSQGEHQCSTNHKTLGRLCDSPWEAEFFKHATTVHVRWRGNILD